MIKAGSSMKLFSRRRFLATAGAALAGVSLATAADATLIEPTDLKIQRLRIGDGQPAHRFIHFTDLHYKGNRTYAETVVKTVNSLSPDFVCFTGDIMEQVKFLPPALEILSGIKSPMFGVPGNHDYEARAPFDVIARCFAATGGAWLLDEQRLIAGGKINLIAATCRSKYVPLPPSNPNAKNIALMHYPVWIKNFGTQKFDLALAGHSHGGQVRLPLMGALFLPHYVDGYDLGMFHTNAGPLYVNPGIGWIFVDARLNCPPEITVFEI